MRALVTATIGLLSCSSSSKEVAQAPVAQNIATPQSVVDVARTVDNSRTLVVALVEDFRTSTAVMTLWTRATTTESWTMNDTWPAVVGRSGSAWGIGLHGAGAPVPSTSPAKREGDGKSPAGIFAIDQVYGYAATATTNMPYQAVDRSWRCIDDPASTHYTKILSSKAMDGWTSEEAMRRNDELYELVVNTKHNPSAVPNGGSCIFLHVWRSADTGPVDRANHRTLGAGTAGCTAMPLAKLRGLVERLASADRPLFVLLPIAEYDAWQARWHLPARN